MLKLLLIIVPILLQAQMDCKRYLQNERRATSFVQGVDYPYWYAVGQLQQESGCRNVISNDGVGSQGVAQITYKVWKKDLQKNGVNNIISIDNQILAQAYIMKACIIQAKGHKLWVGYQIYNGGGLVNKEISRAKVTDWKKAKDNCNRSYSTFKINGRIQKISNCEINYDYSQKVYKYGNSYKTTDTPIQFW